jgi:serine/threonine-protein kinase
VGTWKVADFGIAKWIHADETLTGTGELLGSPSYLAPERIEGHEAQPASDLYAVGVLLYEALCGTRPFSARDPISLATEIREGRYQPAAEVIPDADPQIVAVIERAMRLDPQERFRSAEEMATALTTGETTADVAPLTEPLPAAGGSADGTKTVPVPKLEQTARLPIEQAPEAAPRPSRPRGRLLVIGAAILAIVLVTVLAIAAFSGQDAPPPSPSAGATDSTLPAELDEALQRLEDSVRP